MLDYVLFPVEPVQPLESVDWQRFSGVLWRCEGSTGLSRPSLHWVDVPQIISAAVQLMVVGYSLAAGKRSNNMLDQYYIISTLILLALDGIM